MCASAMHLPAIRNASCIDRPCRFSDNPFVAGDNGWLRFYAGSPILSSNGHHLGTLCCMDR